MSDEYSRWRNCQEPGTMFFVTTTVLGFVPALKDPRGRELLLQILVDDCRFFGAVLHAYCIMDHHLHLVLRAPLEASISKFMQGFKARTAKTILPILDGDARRQLHDCERDGRSLWMRSFRGIPIRSEAVRVACVRYVHLNPVRAGLCEREIDYPWSSAWRYQEGLWNEDEGLLPWMNV